MSEATVPVVPLSELSSAELLIAKEEAVMAVIRKAQMLLRRDPRPPAEVIALCRRLADLGADIRKGTRYELTRDALEPAPLAAVPGPRHRRAPRQRTGDRPVLRSVPWRSSSS